jgi:hypothetical protein
MGQIQVNLCLHLKIFEYMSHKKPMIASDFPVIREVLNEKNSILVEIVMILIAG